MLLVLSGFLLTSCGEATSTKPTKQQWKATLAEKSELFKNGGVIHMKRDEFIGLFGDPAKTQTVGNETYWYYECKDGTMQLVLNSATLSAGFVSTAVGGHLNDY